MRLSFRVGVLPDDIDTLYKAEIPGPLILQVDDIVNICSNPRCLLFSMTDGVRSVPGLEARPIKALKDLPPAGSKVVIRDAYFVSGLLMLVPQGFQLLGGIVEDLESNRMKLDEEEPNMIRRVKRMQTGVAHSSIWKPYGVGGGTIADLLALRVPIPSGSSVQGTPSADNTFGDACSFHEFNVLDAISEINIAEKGFAGRSTRTDTAVDKSYRLTDEEIPVNLDSLRKQWNGRMGDSPIQGKIKCGMAGISGFQFENETIVGLNVDVNDGNETSLVCLGDKVLEKYTGCSMDQVYHSLSPLSKDDTIMDKLYNFKGDMLIEMNKDSAVPIAIEINDETTTSGLQGNMLIEMNKHSTVSVANQIDDDMWYLEC
ncbi:hypothetical protein MKW92_005153 [Papaver armeniacum]|nr:hypothetical protein MKW92_005153 [Papaver armeniacum]